jgi:chromosome partitioning protein
MEPLRVLPVFLVNPAILAIPVKLDRGRQLGGDRVLVVALCNQKGGVGKTTTAVNLSRAAHLRGMRTLVADLDPQANTTTTLLGKAPDDDVETLADVLSARSDAVAADVIVPTGWAGVDVLPSGGDTLADVGSELVAMGPGREHRLREALAPLNGYELAILDSPPALDLLTINALTAADRIVIVTTASLFSADGIARLLATVDAVRRYANPTLTIAGVVINALEERTRRQRHWLNELITNSPAPVWQPPIPKATWIGEAIEAGVGLDEWGSPAATVLADTYDHYLTQLLEATR